jgi:hypothetical protein
VPGGGYADLQALDSSEEQTEIAEAEAWAARAFGCCKEYISRVEVPMLESISSDSVLTPTFSVRGKGLQLQLSRRGSIITTMELDADTIDDATNSYNVSKGLSKEAQKANAGFEAQKRSSVEREVAIVVCGVWCVVCGVWCVVGGWVVCGVWCMLEYNCNSPVPTNQRTFATNQPTKPTHRTYLYSKRTTSSWRYDITFTIVL